MNSIKIFLVWHITREEFSSNLSTRVSRMVLNAAGLRLQSGYESYIVSHILVK